jgi:hypothetical protein
MLALCLALIFHWEFVLRLYQLLGCLDSDGREVLLFISNDPVETQLLLLVFLELKVLSMPRKFRGCLNCMGVLDAVGKVASGLVNGFLRFLEFRS